MNVRHDAAGPAPDHESLPAGRAARPAGPDGHAAAPAVTSGTDPRLANAGAAAAGLLALQRSAGNAAVARLVGPAVQRVVGVDESPTPTTSPAPAPTGEGAASAGGGTAAAAPVTSDGSTTTISGASIRLAAPIAQADGVLRAGTIVADTVVASSYTPGAGNAW